MSFTKSWNYLVACLVTYSMCLLVGTCVMVLHVYLLHEMKKNKRPVKGNHEMSTSGGRAALSFSRSKSMEDIGEQVYDYLHDKVHDQVLWYCTGCSLSAFYLQTIIAFYYRLNDMRVFGSTNWCNDYITIQSILWSVGKYNMYMVFVARVHVAYAQSAYGYSKKIIFGLYIFVTVLCFAIFIAMPWLSGGHTEEVTGNPPNDKVTVCVSEFNTYLAALGFLVDCTISPTLVVMFIRPLRTLFRDSTLHESKHLSIRDIEVQMLPLKYTVTMCIGVLSTISCMLLMATTDAALLVIVDSVVNMICLVTMTSHWKQVYWRLCAPLLQTIAFFDCCFDAQLRANLSRIIEFFASDAEMDKYRKEMTASRIGSSKAMSKSKSMSSKGGLSFKERMAQTVEMKAGAQNEMV